MRPENLKSYAPLVLSGGKCPTINSKNQTVTASALKKWLMPPDLGMLAVSPDIAKDLDSQLFGPILELMNRPSKSFRAELVEISFELARKLKADS